MDADITRRILCSKNFEKEGKELREEIAILARNLTKSYDPRLTSALTNCRLIGLDKQPGIRPIGTGETICRNIGTAITWAYRKDIQEAATPLQTFASYGAGAEAAIHGMKEILKKRRAIECYL